MKKVFQLFTLILLLYGCSESINNTEEFEPIEVDIRMEVQILDTLYQIYSRPFTKIYFTTYKLSNENKRFNFEQTDTTSCPNGWGVKLLNFTISNPSEYIVLGAANEKYDGDNYREIKIDYAEATRRIDSANHASIIKTFAIYYK